MVCAHTGYCVAAHSSFLSGWFARLLLRLMQYVPKATLLQYAKNFALFTSENKSQRGLLFFDTINSRLHIMVRGELVLCVYVCASMLLDLDGGVAGGEHGVPVPRADVYRLRGAHRGPAPHLL